MPISYDDKRARYRGATPANFAPGSPRHDNPVKAPTDVVYARPAIRGHREAFRTKTAPIMPEPEPIPVARPAERIPAEWAFEDTKGTKGAETDKEL